jgi:hypothetical protein
MHLRFSDRQRIYNIVHRHMLFAPTSSFENVGRWWNWTLFTVFYSQFVVYQKGVYVFLVNGSDTLLRIVGIYAQFFCERLKTVLASEDIPGDTVDALGDFTPGMLADVNYVRILILVRHIGTCPIGNASSILQAAIKITNQQQSRTYRPVKTTLHTKPFSQWLPDPGLVC